jgi:hypothetical protein
MAETEIVNPLTGTFQEIWKALKANQTFCMLVPPGNCLEYPVLFEPDDPDTLANSNTPYVAIVFSGFTTNSRVTSSSTLPELRFDIKVSTASQRSGPVLDVVWSIIRAMFAWHVTLTASNSLVFPYIRCARLLSGTQEIKAEKGIKGWVSAMQLEIGLNLKTSDLEEPS